MISPLNVLPFKTLLMLRHTAFAMTLVLTIFLAVFAAQVSGKTIAKTIQQTDLERMLSLTKGMTNKPPSWRPDVAACNWQGAFCNTAGSVTEIAWYGGLGLGGSANLTMLPQGLTYFHLENNNLTGVAEFAFLPRGLLTLDLSSNAFSGSPNLTSLPQRLQDLYLGYNGVSGLPNLTSPPRGLLQLSLYYNLFSGSGTFAPPTGSSNWCTNYPTQYYMCGQRANCNGAFNCSAGVWSCLP